MGIGGSAEAKTLVVKPQGPLASVREAIRQADPGDTIRIEAGVYVGNLRLEKPLALEGVGKPIIRGEGSGSVITVLADGCAIRGLVIERSGRVLVEEDSGILVKSSRNRIEENEIRDVLYGIYLYAAHDNLIRGNRLRGRVELEFGERGNGIHIWNSRGNRIIANAISHMRDGLYLQNASGSLIRENRVFRVRYGLHYMFSDDNTIEGNRFFDNVAGAAIMYSRRIRLRRNIFFRNRGFSSYGLLFQDCDDCVIEGNLIADNAVGIFMEALRRSVFRRNLIATNDVAVYLFSSASENIFTENSFVRNLSLLRVIGRGTTTRWSWQGVGNYWDDYEGFDADGDGIGDVPFRLQDLFERLEGNHPRLRVYLSSAAAEALAFAERAFPIIPGPQEWDPAPLRKPRALWPSEALEIERVPSSRWTFLVPMMMVGISVGLFLWVRKR